MALLKKERSNAISVVKKMIDALKVNVTLSTIKTDLENHPDFPSLLSLSDAFQKWNIDCEAYKIPKEDYSADDMLFPFIAHLNQKNGKFILIHEIGNGEVIFSDEQSTSNQLTEKDFLKIWSGVALHCQRNMLSGESNYRENLTRQTLQQLVIPGIIFVLLSAITYSVLDSGTSWTYMMLTLLKTAGLGLSVLLLIQSINSNNPFILNLCGSSSKSDCNTLLKSSAARITIWLNWSEVGFFYFAGSLLAILINPVLSGVLAWMNLLAFPFVIYSFAYQYFKRNWCLLCSSTQVVLIGEAIVFNLPEPQYAILSLTFQTVFTLALIFLAPVLVWSFIKPYFSKAVQHGSMIRDLNKFKYNSQLFENILTNQARYQISPELSAITLGAQNPATTITMVSNPFCNPCGIAHRTLHEWIENNHNLQLKIIFSTEDREQDTKTIVARHLSALSILEDKSIVADALREWYAQEPKNYNRWAEKYPAPELEQASDISKKHRDWCKLSDITFTPTIFINGYKMPQPYTLEDLKHLIS